MLPYLLDIYASRIYFSCMDPSVARNLFGALTLALADEIACAAASLAPVPGPAAAAMVFLGHEPPS
jgi:hypothetical protein